MNDLRKYINLIESQQQLDEKGGMLDKALSKLQNLPGVIGGDIGSAADARVREKEIYKALRKHWVKTATHDRVNKKSSEALKAYFKDVLEIPDNVIRGMKGLDKPRADLGTVLKNAAADLASAESKSADKGMRKGTGKGAKGAKRTQSAQKGGGTVGSADVDPATISKFTQLGGQKDQVIGAAKALHNDSRALKKLAKTPGSELELLGYLVIKDAGYLG